MRRVVLKTCMDRYLVALEVLILTWPLYLHPFLQPVNAIETGVHAQLRLALATY